MDNKASENVTPNLPKPLPTISTLNWTGEISHEDAKAAFECGVSNIERMKAKPGIPDWLKSFDPVKGHRPDDPEVFGSSRFLDKEAWRPDILRSSSAGRCEVHPGHGGAEKALTFTCAAPVPVGKWYPLGARMRVVLRKVHGSLQAVLEKPEPEETNLITFVLTNEGDDGWCLASVFPGTPDPDPDMEGLNEGDEITLEEAARRGLRVKA